MPSGGDVDPDDIEATYEDGILEVVVPGAAGAAARRIPVRAGARRARVGPGAAPETRAGERPERSVGAPGRIAGEEEATA